MIQIPENLSALSQEEKRALLAQLLQAKAQSDPALHPLSRGQHGLWFLHRYTPQEAGYNVVLAWRLRAALDIDALRRAFQALVDRHPMLRTTYAQHGDVPMQHINERQPIHFEVVDASGWAPEELEDRLSRAAYHPFDLEHGPIVRVVLYQVAPEEYVLAHSIHHIAIDGWSLSILLDELGQLYNAERAGRSIRLPALRRSYIDYVRWQEEMLAGPEGERLWVYWREQLQGDLPRLDLPIDVPRSAAAQPSGAALGFTLEQGLTQRLKALALETGTTLYVVLLAAYQVLLHRYTRQEDILIGTLASGRSRPEFADLVGYFVNHVAVRADMAGNPSFRAHLGRTQNTVLDALDHQDFPFHLLVERLQPAREPGRFPICDVSFVLQKLQRQTFGRAEDTGRRGVSLFGVTTGDAAVDYLPVGDLRFESFPLQHYFVRFDLELHLIEVDESLSGWFQYNRSLFNGETIERLLRHFRTLLESIVAEPDRRLADLPILPEAERRQLLVDFNATAKPYPDGYCIHHLIEQHAAATPDAPAVACGDAQLTYRQLDERANQLAHYLRERGVVSEQLVGLYVERSTDAIVGLLGILKAGGAYVPLDPGYPRERLAAMLADSAVRLVLTQARLVTQLPECQAELLCLDTSWPAIEAYPAGPPASDTGPDNLAYVIYTSGSTGRPKGVLVPHRGLCNVVADQAALFQPGPGDHVLQFASWNFDASIFEIIFALGAGATVELVDQEAQLPGTGLARLMRSKAVSIVTLTPSTLAALPEEELPDLHTITVAGEACPASLVTRWSAGRRFFNLYGPTETTIWASSAECIADGQPPSIGQPIANTQIYLLDAHLEPVPIGVPGEMYIGGIGVVRGYLNRPDLTAERFIPNPFSDFRFGIWDFGLADERDPIQNPKPVVNNVELPKIQNGERLYKTGDLARRRSDGSIEFLGRIDYQVKVRGFRIELGEIETMLFSHPAVQDALAIVREDVPGEKLLTAYVVPTTDDRRPTTEDRGLKIEDSRLDAEAELSSILHPPSSTESVVSGQWSVVGELRAFLKERLPEYMVPARFVVLEALPISPNGKIDRKALPAPDRAVDAATYVAPRTPLETLLAQAWATVLRLERVGIHDNFFELGGHSLAATQVMSRIREVCEADIPLQVFFVNPTIAALAPYIEQARQATGQDARPPLLPQPRAEHPPLSFAQQRLWFLDQLVTDSAFYNMHMSLHMEGTLNHAALRQSLDEIVRRHEALRTWFGTNQGQPYQLIGPPASVPLSIIDLQVLPETERAQAIQQRFDEEASFQFDLSSGPLLRVTLIQTGPASYELLLVMHHIVADGWSVGLLVEELTILYSSYVNGEPTILPELPVQYADFARWQRDWFEGVGERGDTPLDVQLAYWKQQLADLPVLNLPADHPRPAFERFHGARHLFRLPAATSKALRTLGQGRSASLFMTLLALFKTLLYRYTSQDDIVVGTGIANRHYQEIERLIGFFVNTLVLRTRLDGEMPFLELLARVQAMALEAYDHQDLPFEQLVEELQPERDLSRNPLCQVMFVFENFPLPQMELPGLHVSRVENLADSGTSKFDLTFFMWEDADELAGLIEYNRDLFEPETIQRMADHFQNLAAGVSDEPAQVLLGLPLLGPDEITQIVDTWNRTAGPLPPVTAIQQLFERHAQYTPEAPAVIFEGAQLTYGALDRQSNQLAHYLQSLGVGPETRVAICVERSLEMFVGILGILKAGGLYVPLDPGYPPDRLAFMLEDSQASVLITSTTDHRRPTTDDRPPTTEDRRLKIDDRRPTTDDRRLTTEDRRLKIEDSSLDTSEMRSSILYPLSGSGSVVSGRWSVVDLDADWPTIAQAPESPPPTPPLLPHLAYMIYTSGSTGRPKGVMVTHANLLASTQARFSYYPEPLTAYLLLSSYAFDSSIAGIFWTLAAGGALVLPADGRHQDVHYLGDLIAQYDISHTLCIPALYGLILAHNTPARLASLRAVIVAGEACQGDLVEQHYATLPGAALYNEYGPTESSVWCSVYRCMPGARYTQVPIGRPIENTQLYLLDQRLNPVPVGVPGEVYVGGAGITCGYLHQPGLTAERFIPNPFAPTTDDRRPTTESRDKVTRRQGEQVPESGDAITVSPLHRVIVSGSSVVSGQWSVVGGRLYRTGDLARYLPDGNIVFLGRVDHQVKLRGFRIDLEEIEAQLRWHNAIQDAVVLAHADETGVPHLVAYVTQDPHYRGMDQGSPEGDEHVQQWQTLYEETYQQEATGGDPTFNIVGWNSSYTGEPLPASAMHEWVDQAVARILALRPRRVLELGCGSGLLLFRIAPQCEFYMGTDFSQEALDYVQRHLEAQKYSNVALEQRAADQIDDLEAGSFDTIVLNSVVQYFPGADYLLRVLRSAIRLLAPGGAIFIGDVRHLGLLRTFHTTIQLAHATGDQTCETLLQQALKQMQQEQELLLAPNFFAALPHALPQIGAVQIQLKRGDEHNELTRFRYDVVLRLGAERSTPAPAWQDWQRQGLSVETIGERLADERPASLAIARIPNARLAREIAQVERIAALEGNATVASLPAEAAATPEGIEPERFWKLGEALGYHVALTWCHTGELDRYDLLFSREPIEDMHGAMLPDRLRGEDEAQFIRAYANNPLQGKFARKLVPELRTFLQRELPDYMIPDTFMLLDRMPLTPNGKLDRRALPAPERSHPDLSNTYVAPRTAEEQLLADIWCEVLGLSRAGIHDNFFELGGDSILSIQIVARANEAGLQLQPRQLFQHQTIAELATVAQERATVQSPQEAISGTVPLTPIQRWFIAQEFAEPDHWNQALLLKVPADIRPEDLHRAIQALLDHHDALRLRLVAGSDGRRQVNQASEHVSFEQIDLTHIAPAERARALEDTAAAIQAGLALDQGPLMRAALFHTGAEHERRLLIVIHHLAVDGVSWRILLEDLRTACRHAARGQAIRLPLKTSSFKQWAERLQAYQPADSLPYWRRVFQAPTPALPRDTTVSDERQANLEAAACDVVVRLTPEETQGLLQDAPRRYQAQINDVLLTALLQAFAPWTGETTLRLDLEGHGREDLFEDIDLSRTVGWFTSMFPVRLALPASAGPCEMVGALKEQLRQVPEHGIGYGILAYLSNITDLPREAAEISFNYLGRFDQETASDSLFQLAAESSGPARSPRNRRPHLLQVNGAVIKRRLEFTFRYCSAIHHAATIEALGQRFAGALRDLIAYARAGVAPDAGNVDTALAQLTPAQLRRLVERYPGLESVYPLAPTQQGLLFHTLYASDEAVYLEQLIFTFTGRLDFEAFRQSWQRLVERHAIFRTAFVWEEVDQPLQAVQQAVEPPLEYADWRGAEPDEQKARLDVLLDEAQRSLNLTEAPLMRLHLIQQADEQYLFVWTHHHLLLDGWSGATALQELFQIYEALAQGQTVALPPAPAYRSYIAWLREQPTREAEQYWRTALAGFTRPTQLPISRISSAQSYDTQIGGLSREATERLATFARSWRLTVNTCLQAAWAILLSRYSGEQDVLFGTVSSGRPPTIPAVERMVGLFVNTVPLRVQMPPERQLRDWLRDLQDQLAALRQYEHYPLVRIQRWSAVPQDQPLFESVFAFENYPFDFAALENGSLKLGDFRYQGKTHYPLSLSAGLTEQLKLRLVYDCRLFYPAVAAQMLEQLEDILMRMIDQSDSTLAQLIWSTPDRAGGDAMEHELFDVDFKF